MGITYDLADITITMDGREVAPGRLIVGAVTERGPVTMRMTVSGRSISPVVPYVVRVGGVRVDDADGVQLDAIGALVGVRRSGAALADRAARRFDVLAAQHRAERETIRAWLARDGWRSAPLPLP